MGTKRDIGPVPRSSRRTDREPYDIAVKENLELIMGRRGQALTPLPLTASLEDVIRKVNAIIEQLQ